MADPNPSSADIKTVHWGSGIPQQESGSQAATTGAGKQNAQASIGACDACRARKVRCLANENSMSSKCQRCARAGRECVYTVHSKTRRRKRTDTRVKELEEKVKNLSMLLEQGRLDGKPVPQPVKSVPDGDTMENEDEEAWSDEGDVEGEGDVEPPLEKASSSSRKQSPVGGFQAPTTSQPQDVNIQPLPNVKPQAPEKIDERPANNATSPDIIERGIISMEKAQELVDRYVNDLFPHYPAVLVPPGTRAADLRTERPVLFLSTIAAAAGNQDPALNLALNQEILQVYAKCVALKGSKSLDLVQSMLVSILWYYPPDRFEEMKFHQYIHMAATMALDLGLGKRPRANRSQEAGPKRIDLIPSFTSNEAMLGRGQTVFSQTRFPDSSKVESRRTLLACYLSCSSVSISLRLPNMLRFTSWMQDCVNTLETSPDAAPTDKRLIAWVRMQRLVEECNITFSLDDPGNTASLADDNVQQNLKGYEKQMDMMKKDFESTPGLLNDFLEANFHVNNMYIHEIGMHPEHDSDDFRPPFFVTAAAQKPRSKLGIAYVNAIMACVSSAQSVLKIFCRLKSEDIRALPAFLYARILYSAIVLIKLDVSIDAPQSEIGKMVDRESLMTKPYVEKTLVQMKRVAGNDNKCILGAKFYTILGKLVMWFRSVSNGPHMNREAFTFDPTNPMQSANSKQEITLDPQASMSMLNDPIAQAVAAAPIPQREPMVFSLFNGFPQAPAPAPSATNSDQGSSVLSDTTQKPSSNVNNMAASNPVTSSASNSTSTFTPPNSQAAQSHGTPATDYSSPEMMDASSFSNNSRIPYEFPMEVDPSFFRALEGVVDPFTYNQDPNDWFFDGMDYEAALEGVEGVDWDAFRSRQAGGQGQ